MKKAILLGVAYDKREDVEKNLIELEELAKSMGILCAAKFWQFLRTPVNTYAGKGKLEKIADYIQLYGADGIITDDELSVVQKSKLKKLLKVEVIDRTQLILRNFSRSARTREGKNEVELATLEYRISHLKGLNGHLSRTGGGIGTRGPGESKLEMDKRAIRVRIRQLRKKIERISENRFLKKRKRNESMLPKVSIVGYTNAGKSMLLKKISGFETKSENKLFTTLDPTTKKAWLGENVFVLFSDTVGFISKLPTQLVKAFHSTLEDILDADLILLVVDGHDDQTNEKLKVSERVISDIGASDIPVITVINKIDLCNQFHLKKLMSSYPDASFISAKMGLYTDDLMERIREKLTEKYLEKNLEISNESWSRISRTTGVRIMNFKQLDESVRVRLKIHPELVRKVMGETDVLS